MATRNSTGLPTATAPEATRNGSGPPNGNGPLGDAMLELMLRGVATHVARKKRPKLVKVLADLRLYIVGALYDLHGFLPRVWGEVVGCQATSYNLNGARLKALARHNDERRLLETVSDAIRGKTATFKELCAIAEQAPHVLSACRKKTDAERVEAVRSTAARVIHATVPGAPASLEDSSQVISVPGDIEIGDTRLTEAKVMDQYNTFLAAMDLKLTGQNDDAMFRLWTTIPENKRNTVEIAVYDVLRHLTRVIDASAWKKLGNIVASVESAADEAEVVAKTASIACSPTEGMITLNMAVGLAPSEEAE